MSVQTSVPMTTMVPKGPAGTVAMALGAQACVRPSWRGALSSKLLERGAGKEASEEQTEKKSDVCMTGTVVHGEQVDRANNKMTWCSKTC